MKKILILLLVICNGVLFAQLAGIPDSINYQAVLRDASGNVMPPGTSGTLNFKIYSDYTSSNADYEENHTFTISATGIVNLFIGGGAKVGSNTFANVNWKAGSASYEVRLNGALISPRQAFASVPYALYAKTSGAGSLPAGLTNQTLYYDPVFQWKATNSLLNDGTRIGIGALPGNRVKLNIFTADPLDTSVVHVGKLNANTGDALFRGFISGSTSTTVVSPFAPIIAADLRTNNGGNGMAIGVSGMANSGNGIAIGLSGTAFGSSSSTIVGVYSKVDTTGNPNAYAAVFETGKVLVGGDMYFPNATALPGSVFKIDAQKRGFWGPGAAGNGSVTINQGGIVNVTPSGIPSSTFNINAAAPIFGSSGIGNIVPGAYPNYNLIIPTPSISFNGVSGNLTYNQTPFITNVNISPAVSLAGSLLFVGTSTVILNGLNIWTKPTPTVVTLVNNSDFVGIGTAFPTTKFEVSGNTRFADVNSNVGYVSLIENNASSGIDGGVLRLTNTGVRSIGNSALLVENSTTKTTGSNSTKKGLEIQSTLPWTGPGLVNIGLLSNVGGANPGFNYSGIFTGGQVGINNNAPKSTLAVFGSVAVKKVSVNISYNMLPDDYIVEVNSAVSITVQLPQSALVDEGTLVVIRSRTAFFINVAAQGADQIQPLGSAVNVGSVTVPSLNVIRLYKSGGVWVEM